MPTLQKVVDFLDNYLKIDDIEDSSWNGLQFEGAPYVRKIAFAVDASVDSFERATQENADMLIVHHGHFWSNHNPSVRGWTKERVKRARWTIGACKTGGRSFVFGIAIGNSPKV